MENKLLITHTFNIFWKNDAISVSLVCCDIIDTILMLFGNVVTIGNLSNEDKMRIHRLYEQGFGAKAIRASYPDKNWSLNTLNTICHLIDETGSAVTRREGSGRRICHKSSWIIV